MSEYLGSWKIDDSVTFSVNTHSASTGTATYADSEPTYRVYEDETATPILTGTMAKLDDANRTEERICVGDRLVTAAGPGVAMEFALALVELLVSREKAEELAKAMVVK